jgi:putative membrane protein
MLLADVNPWRWQAHPEAWALVGGIVLLGWYAARVIGPKVVPEGEVIVSTRQKLLFGLAVVLLLVAGGWPMHDIGEQYLYSVHMVQHLLISFFIPPLLLLATPVWLARLVLLDEGPMATWIRRLARPLPAGLIFNAITVFLHWQGSVTESVRSAPYHYTAHVLLFASALLMWTPVCGPLPELRISRPAKMVYLFLMSVIPTIPGGWLTFAEKPVYRVYDLPIRLWNIDVIADQQAAGAIMKIFGGFYLWLIITVIFFKWASSQELINQFRNDRPTVPSRPMLPDDLTFEAVADEFDKAGPAPLERVPPVRDERTDEPPQGGAQPAR